MSRRVCILQGAHLDSQRVPRKLFEKVGAVRLIDSGIARLKAVAQVTGATPILAIPKEDQELIDAAQGLEVIGLMPTKTQGIPNPFADVDLRGRFDWVHCANFLCRPFLSVATAVICVDACKHAKTPFVTTKCKRGLLWDERKAWLLGRHLTADTENNPLYFELAHLGYGMPVELVMEEDKLGLLAEPFAVEVMPEEEIDIDLPKDLAFARTYCNGLGIRP